MKKSLSVFILLLITFCSFAKPPKNQYVAIQTKFGKCIVRLYNETPKHRDNFIKLAKEGFFNGTLFHRVIQNFMIQGGDPDSKKAKPGQVLGDGDLKYTIDAEFRDSLFHKKGVIAAARDNNPKKASSASQFYLVEGKRFTSGQLDTLEQTRLKGRKIPVSEREIYESVGGVPHLDQNYTVFGEIVAGLNMVDRIAAVKKDAHDRPLQDIPMTVTVLSKRECKWLNRILE